MFLYYKTHQDVDEASVFVINIDTAVKDGALVWVITKHFQKLEDTHWNILHFSLY